MTSTRIRSLALMATLAALLTAAAPGHAGQPETGQPLRVALDKAEVVRLDGAATVVLVANPRIADVVLERGKILFILGRQPGETRLYVYGDNGQRLIERDIIVVPAHERIVTITRGTRVTDYGCDARCGRLARNAGTNEIEEIDGEPPAPAATPPAAPAAPAAVSPAKTPTS